MSLLNQNEPATTEADFQKTVLAGVEQITTEQKSARDKITAVLSDVTRLDGATKKAFEELSKLQRVANDQDANGKAFIKQLEQINAMVRRQARSSFGSGSQRIAADEQLRARLNLVVRQAVDNGDGRMKNAIGTLQKALGEDSSPGSTMIIGQLADEIYDTLAEYGVWTSFEVKRVGTKATSFPVKTARVAAGWLTSEAATIGDDTTKAGTTVNLSVLPLAALLNVSLQFLDDSEYDVTSDITDDFAQAAAFVLDDTALNADGTANSAYGGFTGGHSGGTARTAAAGNVTVETTDLADWLAVLATVDPQVLQRAAMWWMHPLQLVRALAVRDNNGRSIFLNALEAPAHGSIGSILGYPVKPSHAAPSTNVASSKVALFGDPRALVIPLRRDFSFEASDHHKWNTLQRSFRGYLRGAVGVRRATGLASFRLPAA